MANQIKFEGYRLYGGATITRVFDKNATEYVGCCASRISDGGNFGFHIFKRLANESIYRDLPLQHFCTGRGSVNNGGLWIAGKDSELWSDVIPGFVPFA